MVSDESTVSPRTYLVVIALLVTFTLLEVGLRYVPGLPSGLRTGGLVLLAGSKVALVMLYFMHLKYDDVLFWLPVAIAGISGVTLVLIVSMSPEGLAVGGSMAGMPATAPTTAASATTAAPGPAVAPSVAAQPTATASGTQATATGSGAAAAGSELAQQQGCLSCHSIDGSRGVGPTWLGLYGSAVELQDGTTVQANDQYLAESIQSPDAKVVQGFPAGVMPDYGQQLTQDQVGQLVAYVISLGSAQ